MAVQVGLLTRPNTTVAIIFHEILARGFQGTLSSPSSSSPTLKIKLKSIVFVDPRASDYYRSMQKRSPFIQPVCKRFHWQLLH